MVLGLKDTIVNLCESGLVYYNSSTIPRISGFDVLSSMLEKAHRKNIKIYAWLSLLYDKWTANARLLIDELILQILIS